MNDRILENLKEPEGFDIRYMEASDASQLKRWLQQEGMHKCFPMRNEKEIEDAVARWISFSKIRAGLTATIHGQPIGLAALYLMPYQSLAHQCEWGLILDNSMQNKGVGKVLFKNLLHLAKTKFKLELLHLQVYEDNARGIHFFQELGFKEFGRQSHWLKEGDKYKARIFMERFIN